MEDHHTFLNVLTLKENFNMNTDAGGIVTPSTVLAAGRCLVTVSYAAGVTLLLYFLHAGHRARAIRLITRNACCFAKNATPFVINVLLCWCLSLAFARLIASSRPIMEFTSEHYVASKVTLNLVAFGARHYLHSVQSIAVKIVLFVGYLILIAASEVMCIGTPVHMTPNTTVAILVFWLTALILAAPDDAYKRLSLSQTLNWKRCSLVYGLTTGMCHNWYRAVFGREAAPALDAFLLVLVVHVQLVCLCVTYFSEGQQTLRNIAGEGQYNPTADSLEMYFTVDSMAQRMCAYAEIVRPSPLAIR